MPRCQRPTAHEMLGADPHPGSGGSQPVCGGALASLAKRGWAKAPRARPLPPHPHSGENEPLRPPGTGSMSARPLGPRRPRVRFLPELPFCYRATLEAGGCDAQTLEASGRRVGHHGRPTLPGAATAPLPSCPSPGLTHLPPKLCLPCQNTSPHTPHLLLRHPTALSGFSSWLDEGF